MRIYIILNKIEKCLFWNKQKKKFSKWCDKTDYIIVKIVFFYIYYPLLFVQKCVDRKYDHIKYSDKKTRKYLDILIPRAIAHSLKFIDGDLCHPEEYFMISNCYEFMFDCFRFEDVFFRARGNMEMYLEKYKSASIDFLVNGYAINGYEKMKILDEKDWVEVKKMFPQIKSIPARIDNLGSVIFYKTKFKRSSNEVPNKAKNY